MLFRNIIIGMATLFFCGPSVEAKVNKIKAFKAHEIVNVQDKPSAIAVADFNGDKAEDLAVLYSNTVHLYYAKNGKFTNQANITIKNDKIKNIIAADIDGDGIAELIGSAAGQRIYIYSKKDNFTKYRINTNANQWTQNITAGKLFKTSYCDILTGATCREFSKNGKIQYGYFNSPDKHSNGNAAICDLNADGINDVVFAVKKAAGLRLYYGPFPHGEVYIKQLVKFIPLKTKLMIDKLAVGDINGDFRPDIIASTFSGYSGYKRKTLIFFQNAPLSFTPQKYASKILTGSCIPITADFNGDKMGDLALADYHTGIIKIYLAKKFRKFPSRPSVILNTGLKSITDFKVKNLSGSKLPDLIVAGFSGNKNQIKTYINNL